MARSLRKTRIAGRAVGPGVASEIHAARIPATGGTINHVPPSEDAVRAAIAEGKCPFCGKGPWKMLPVHTNKVHGVDKWQLRDLAGLSGSEPLCDPETRKKMSTAAKRNPDAVKRALAASLAPGVKKNPRRTRAGNEQKKAILRQWIEAHPDEIQALRAGFRDRMNSPEARAKWEASMAQVRAEREYTPEQREAFAEMMARPEVEAKRAERRAITRTDTCSVEDCDRLHAARGMCQMHWARWRTEQNRRTTCTVCAGPLASQRATRMYCSSSCKNRAARAKAAEG